MKSESESTNVAETHDFQTGNSTVNSLDEAAQMLRAGIESAKAGMRDAARKSLFRVAELEPGNETAWLWLASISEYPEELLGFLQKVLAINPTNSRAVEWQKQTKALLAKTLVQRGITANQENKKTLAIQFMKQSLDYEPNNTDSWMWLAAFSDSPQEKLEYFQKVLDVDPENETVRLTVKQIKTDWAKARVKEGNIAAVSGERERAYEILQEVMSFDGNCEDAWLLQAYLAESFTEKIVAFEMVVEINPKNEFALTSLRSLLTMAQSNVVAEKEKVQEVPPIQAQEEFADGQDDEDSVLEYLSDLEKSAQDKVAQSSENHSYGAEKFEETTPQFTESVSLQNQISQDDDLLDLIEMQSPHQTNSVEELLNDENLFLDFASSEQENHQAKQEADQQVLQSEQEFVYEANQSQEISFEESKETYNFVEESEFEETIKDSVELGFANESESPEVVEEPEMSAEDEVPSDTYFESVAPTDELDTEKFDEAESQEIVSASESLTEEVETQSEDVSEEFEAMFARSTNEPFADEFFNNPQFDTTPKVPQETEIVITELHNFETVKFESSDEPVQEVLSPMVETEEVADEVLPTAETHLQTVEETVEKLEAKEESVEVQSEIIESETQFAATPAEEIVELQENVVEVQEAFIEEKAEVENVESLEVGANVEEISASVESLEAAENVQETIEVAESDDFTDNAVEVSAEAQYLAVQSIEVKDNVEETVQSEVSEENSVTLQVETAAENFVEDVHSEEAKTEQPVGTIQAVNAFSNVVVTTQVLETNPPVTAEDLHHKTILVVDDSPTIRKLVTNKLEKCGHRVLAASDGMDALAILNSETPDLVLLDITMPRLDGYQVCKLIRGNHLTKDLPVVLISGKDGFFDKVRGRMAGSTAYITKPFGPDTLVRAVETYVL